MEARLRRLGAHTQAVMLFAFHAWGAAADTPSAEDGWHGDGTGAPPMRQLRLFHELVLPEFVAWLHSDGLSLDV